MKVFVSWSGETSRRYAIVLRDWLPTVLPNVFPWVSSEDIEKGKRWSTELAKELEACDCGIICVDPTNVNSPWMNFEAGALSKSVEFGRVFPLLFGLNASDITGPLTQFQITTFTRDDVVKLLKGIATSSDETVDCDKLLKLMKYSWAGLRDEIAQIVDGDVVTQNAYQPTKMESRDTVDTRLDELSVNILLALAHGKDSYKTSSYAESSWLAKHLSIPIVKLEHLIHKLDQQDLVKLYVGGKLAISRAGVQFLIEKGVL